ncbi:MAG: tail fiber domain-containing protein [Chitinophagales bacterium]
MRSVILCTVGLCLLFGASYAQTNTFPASGNVGIGTITPTNLLQVEGGTSQFGTGADHSAFGLDGDLTFSGNADFLVAGDHYAFRYSGNPNYGLVFSNTNSRYEFRDGTGAPVFWATGGGNAYIKNKLAIGSTTTPGAMVDITPTTPAAIRIKPYDVTTGATGELRFNELAATGNNYVGFKAPDNITANLTWVLPAADGTSGQFLITDGSGNLSWASAGGGTYTAGTGIDITGSVITNTAPDQVVTLNGTGTASISGTYPNYTIDATSGISGTANYLVKFTGTNVGGNSMLYDNGTSVGINTITPSPTFLMDIVGGDMRANGVRVGRGNSNVLSNTALGSGALLGNTTGSLNTAIGYDVLNYSTTASENTGCGYGSLFLTTTGNNNSAFGSYALFQNTTGHDNTAMGRNALNINSTGTNNIAVGSDALYNNTTASGNVAIGSSALYANIIGSNNIAIGQNALNGSTTSSSNVAIGNASLSQLTTGFYNVAVGEGVMSSNTDGWGNSGIGALAMNLNTTGYNNSAFGGYALFTNSTGFFNDAFGYYALVYNTTGYRNAAFGNYALYANTTGSLNAAFGKSALYGNTTGTSNIGIGYSALLTNTTGNNNTAVGVSTDVTASNLSNATAIGFQTTVNASNKARMGNSSVSSNGGQVSWTAYSDARIKNNVQENVPGLNFIKGLRPVTYHFDVKKENALLGVADTVEWEGKYDIEKIQWTGFIAQEVDAAAQEIGYNFSGVDKSGDVLGLRYAEFVVPLVKAVQEIDSDAQAKDARIDALEKEIEDLKNEIAGLGNTTQSNVTLTEDKTSVSVSLSGAWLEQNVPNPFAGSTIIRCYIPEGSTSAELMITAQNGITLSRTALTQIGINEITVDASAISAGAYQYTLIVDGQIVGTKQMILAK